MPTLAISKTKKVAKLSPQALSLQNEIRETEATYISPSVPPVLEPVEYTPADLRPGKLLLVEFSRPSGTKSLDTGIGDEGAAEAEDAELQAMLNDEAKQRRKEILKKIERMTLKVVNMGYAKMIARFAHCSPWGFFCQDHEVTDVYKILEEVQQCAFFVNKWAIEMKSPRRVRIDVYPLSWDPTDRRFRERVGEMIAEKLIELREAYTCKIMWNYRVRYDKARNIEKLLKPGPQADIVREALNATKAQRKIMIAIYGDKCPIDWTDPHTGRLKKEIKLDFTSIDKAIRYFYPSWEPPAQPGLITS